MSIKRVLVAIVAVLAWCVVTALIPAPSPVHMLLGMPAGAAGVLYAMRAI